jgi:hypothetical protein
MKSVLPILMVVFGLTGRLVAADTTGGNTIYDSNPKHLWNRLNQTLFERTAPDGKKYGLDELDILYWANTTNLLSRSSRSEAFAVLDEFINTHGEKLISDPVKRALLQRDLWQLFDWTTYHHEGPNDVHRAFSKNFPVATRELQIRLAVLLRRLALTPNEIAALPDNYAQADSRNLPDLPHHLFDTNGDWVSLGISSYNSDIAPIHSQSFGSRSGFSIAVHVPENRQAAISYLENLRKFAQDNEAWVYHTNRNPSGFANAPKEILALNPAIPQFPTNTEWALVRRMYLIDLDGNIQPSRLVESIQVRRYVQIKRAFGDPHVSMHTNIVQKFFEFQLDRRHNASLRAIAADEAGFPFVQFMGKGIDLFEAEYKDPSDNRKPLTSAKYKEQFLQTCFSCHSDPGIFSVLSYTGSFSGSNQRYPTDLTPIDSSLIGREALNLKRNQYSWGLLQGLWHSED